MTETIAQDFKPFDLQAMGLEQSSLLTKTFYVQFQSSAVIQRLFENLRDNVSATPNDTINPHLSLLYQRITEEQRKGLCQRAAIVPMGTYRFDTLRVLEMDLPVEDLQPLRTWRTVAEHRLNA